MKLKVKSIICTVIVIVIILGTMLTAGAGAVWFNKSISTTSYTPLAGSTKAINSSYGVLYNTVVGGDFASVRAGDMYTSTVRVVKSNNLYTIPLLVGYDKSSVYVTLFGMGQGGTNSLAGTWDPDY